MLDLEAACDERRLHDARTVGEPGEVLAALGLAGQRTHLLRRVFVGEKECDRAALEYRLPAVLDRGYLAVRVRIGGIFRTGSIGATKTNDLGLIRDVQLFEKPQNACGARLRRVIKCDHRLLPIGAPLTGPAAPLLQSLLTEL